jgi:transcriptional regulator with PAS, ATPase and Fis domain
MNWTIGKLTNTGFGLAIALLIVISVVAFFSIDRLIGTIRLLTHSHAVIDTLEDLNSHLKDAQRGERGYILTGEERYLDPFHRAVDLIETELAELKDLVATDVSQRGNLATLEAGIIDNLAEHNEAIALRRSDGFEAAVRSVRSGEGKHQMDSIERTIVKMQREEEMRLEGRSQLTDRRAAVAIATIGVGGLMAITLLGVAVFLINREVAERSRAERGLQNAHNVLEGEVRERTAELRKTNEDLSAEIAERKRSEARLAISLEHIEKSRDDLQFMFDQLRLVTAIIDDNGRITFLSKNARILFDNVNSDLVGGHWEEVLPIDDEDKAALKTMSRLPSEQRSRIPTAMEGRDGRRYSTEIEIVDDPRTTDGKILSLGDISEIYDRRRYLGGAGAFENMIGKSNLMRRAFQQIQDVAKVESTVLIEGETGTGKELVAAALHAASRRSDQPFVPVNCAGLTDSLLASQLFGHRRGAFTGAVVDQKGLFQAAEGGTLFLDEIGDVSPAVQASLLRALQEKEITRLGDSTVIKTDVRVIAATHRDLAEETKAGRFRADLFYRLRIARIEVPPLRARRDDIPLLAEWFLGQSRTATGKSVRNISADAMRALMKYAWPGNVRELKSAIEFGVIRCKGKILHAGDLPPEIGLPPPGISEAANSARDGDDLERQRLLSALERSGGNRAAAARLLGIGRTTLYRRLADFNIHLP